jgi:adenylate kinase family enzyme
MKIYITGPSGLGTTTLGRTLSHRLNIFHGDSDDFFWLQTDPPFTKKETLIHCRRCSLGLRSLSPMYCLEMF